MTSNFDFIQATWRSIHADCVRAESYLSSDLAAACVYSRRAIEQVVGHLYDVIGLRRRTGPSKSARTAGSYRLTPEAHQPPIPRIR